jgi:formiminotetrahydrofolate cyclodeaminase
MQISPFPIDGAAWKTVAVGKHPSQAESSAPLGGQGHSVPAGVLPVADVLESVAGDAATAGAGSATGIAAAMAAGIVAMAAERSRGSWSGAGGAVAQAATLQARCLELARADAEAFAAAAAALERGSDVEEPLRLTVDLLLSLGDAAADTGELAALVATHCERLVHADAQAAALVAEGAVKAVEALVRANLGVTPGDERLDRICRAREAAGDAARRAGEST